MVSRLHNAPRHTLAIRYDKQWAEMLVSFANAQTFEYFYRRYRIAALMEWAGGEQEFQRSQELVRAIWEGKEDGAGEVARHLGLMPKSRQDLGPPLITVDWKQRSLLVIDRDLNDLVWLTLLQHADQLAICANRDGGCPTPYFLRKKPTYKYCSSACSAPAQRKFKREWWSKVGSKQRQRTMRVAKRLRPGSKGH